MPDSSVLQNQAMGTANAICNTFDHNDLSSIAKCRQLAEHIFGKVGLGKCMPWVQKRELISGCQGWSEKGADVYRDLGSTSLHPQCYAVSNCHIDTACKCPTAQLNGSVQVAQPAHTGLWPFSATQQKVARSWSTQVDLMERYPEHRFAASQAQQYKWLEELYPMLFERVKEKVTSGQFQPIGEGIELTVGALKLTISPIRWMLGRDGLQHAFR